jgi:cytochrome c biogenesis protein CcdA
MHHQLRRSLGGVKRAVLALYGISGLFAVLGVTLAWLVMETQLRVRVIYVIAIVLFSFVGVIAVKAARRQQRQAAQAARAARATRTTAPAADPAAVASERHTASEAKVG